MSWYISPVEEARKYLFVREVYPNKGWRVNGIQAWCGGQSGDSWCAEFATMVLDVCFQGDSPIPRLRAVQDIYMLAKTHNGWLTTNPVPNDLFIYVNDNDLAHHVGIYTGNGNGIAGNTSADGTSSNGDRVAEHQLITNPNHIKFIHYF